MNHNQGWRILLSHHRVDQLHLCYPVRLAGLELCLCARCAGLYPGLAFGLAAARLWGPWPWWLSWGLLFLAPLPALIEWGLSAATGRQERANWIRTATGLGLGLGIGTNLAINTVDLLGYPVMAQFVFFLASVWTIWMVSYGRRSRIRREALLARMNRPSLQEFVLGQAAFGVRTGETDPDQDQPPQSK